MKLRMQARKDAPGSATRVPAGRSAPFARGVALASSWRVVARRNSAPRPSHRKQTRCWIRLAAFLRNLFCFQTNL